MIIDAHHHWMPRDAVENPKRYLRPGQMISYEDGNKVRISENGANLITFSKTRTLLNKHVEDMDRSGVDLALISIATWQDWTTKETAPLINDEMHQAIQQFPDRFAGLAAVSPTEAGADEELDRAVKDLGMKGVCITTNFHGQYPDEETYRPLFKKASQLRVPVFIHAAGTPGCNRDLLKFDMDRSLGRQYDHLLAVVRLLYSDYVKDFPNLVFHHGHYGGGFFLFQKRFLGGDSPNPDLHDKSYKKYLSSFRFDTAPAFWWGTKEFESAVNLIGSQLLLYGSDYPVGAPEQKKTKMGADIIRKSDISDREKAKILGSNAARIFNLKA